MAGFGADPFDTAVGYAFSVKIDGLEIPHVMEVNGLKHEVDTIEVKHQLKDGKFKITKIPGRYKAGSFTVTRGLTKNPAVTGWLKKVMSGDVGGSRKTAVVEVRDYKGSSVMKWEFKNCFVESVEWPSFKAGATDPATETFSIAYEESEVK